MPFAAGVGGWGWGSCRSFIFSALHWDEMPKGSSIRWEGQAEGRGGESRYRDKTGLVGGCTVTAAWFAAKVSRWTAMGQEELEGGPACAVLRIDQS